jgi:hypothetical protein
MYIFNSQDIPRKHKQTILRKNNHKTIKNDNNFKYILF